MSAFGDSLRKIRKSRNMSQDDLAELLGTSKQVISRYETGQRSPKVSVVDEYASKLGVTIAELTGSSRSVLELAFSPDSPASRKLRAIGEQLTPLATADPGEEELLSIYRSMNDLGRQTLVDVARGLAANPDMRKDGPSGSATA